MQKIKKTLLLSLLTCAFSLPSFGEGKNNEEKNQVKYSAGDFVQTLTLNNGESETNWTKKRNCR